MVSEEMLNAGEAAYDAVPEGFNAHRIALGKAYLAMSQASPIEDRLVKHLRRFNDSNLQQTADHIEAQSQSIRVMREALEKIASRVIVCADGSEVPATAHRLASIARSALGASGE